MNEGCLSMFSTYPSFLGASNYFLVYFARRYIQEEITFLLLFHALLQDDITFLEPLHGPSVHHESNQIRSRRVSSLTNIIILLRVLPFIFFVT